MHAYEQHYLLYFTYYVLPCCLLWRVFSIKPSRSKTEIKQPSFQYIPFHHSYFDEKESSFMYLAQHYYLNFLRCTLLRRAQKKTPGYLPKKLQCYRIVLILPELTIVSFPIRKFRSHSLIAQQLKMNNKA